MTGLAKVDVLQQKHYAGDWDVLRQVKAIKDQCLTELEPEEIDENGDGWTLNAIGFRHLPDELIQQIGKKYQIYL